MIRILYQILRTGIKTEPVDLPADTDIREIGAELKAIIDRHFNGSRNCHHIRRTCRPDVP